MQTEFYVASLEDLDLIYSFAANKLSKLAKDPTAFMFESWTAPWRKESLEHYLKGGWCFIATTLIQNKREVSGFFLAQPILFMSRQTQSLWIEMLLGENENVTEFLIEIAVKTAREKHLQRVLFADYSHLKPYLDKFGVHQQQNDIGEWNYNK